MNRYAMAATGLLAVLPMVSTTAHAQCWWTGFNYACSAPAWYTPTYSSFWYGYGYQPWWRFGYDVYGY